MTKFEAKQFNIPKLKGISEKNIEEHLKLYEGYVKHANLILEHINDLSQDSEKYAYELGELQRRFSFEFDGMRNHELYFSQLEGGAKNLNERSPLKTVIEEEWGGFEKWLTRFKSISLTRGVGWASLVYDPISKKLLNNWNDEQHLGHLTGVTPILVLDMWEHSYVADYEPSGKKNYVEDFFENLNWEIVEKRFAGLK